MALASPLNSAQKLIIDQASRQAIENVFQDLSSHLQNQNWLGLNSYSINTTKVLSDHLKSGSVAHGELGQYIAASAPTHCMDGWSYLGRALACMLAGDTRTARHLAYYAELRAAMSLLASGGIAVFNHQHLVLNARGECLQVPCNFGTHQFTWLALEYWASRPQATNLVGEIVSPHGVPLAGWLAELRPGATFSFVAAEWLNGWGLDLSAFVEDHDTRNEISYRPSRLIAQSPATIPDGIAFLRALWEANSPIECSRFESLDRYLLRRSLCQIKKALTIQEPTFEAEVRWMIDRVNFSSDPSIKQAWAAFLLSQVPVQDPLIILEAEKHSPITDPSHHLHVIARSALLLRIATGSCARLIAAPRYRPADLEFWWKSLGAEHGLWSPTDEPGDNVGDIISLWDEVQDALDDLDLQMQSSAFICVADSRRRASRPLSVLCGCERIGLWGIIP